MQRRSESDQAMMSWHYNYRLTEILLVVFWAVSLAAASRLNASHRSSDNVVTTAAKIGRRKLHVGAHDPMKPTVRSLYCTTDETHCCKIVSDCFHLSYLRMRCLGLILSKRYQGSSGSRSSVGSHGSSIVGSSTRRTRKANRVCANYSYYFSQHVSRQRD